MIIPTVNNLTVNAPKTYLAGNVSLGTSVFPVKSLSGFSTSWAIQLGETGEAQTEILLLSALTPSGTLGTTTANSAFDHPADTPVYAIKYNQIVFERSTTGTAGTATPITGGTIAIQPNNSQTIYDDTTGSASYAYKTYYLNSVTGGLTTESDWITSAGFPFYSLGKIRQRIKDKLVNATYLPDDTLINDWVNEWLESMTNAAIDVDEGYQMGTTSIAYATGVELGTITATDFKQLRRVWYADASGTFQASKMESNTFSPNKTFSTTYPYFYFEGDTVLGRKPSDQGPGTFICEYYKLSPVVVNDADTIPQNMWGYTKSFVNYGESMALNKDQKAEQATAKLQEAEAERALFKREITPRNKTGVTYIDIVEDTAADQELWL